MTMLGLSRLTLNRERSRLIFYLMLSVVCCYYFIANHTYQANEFVQEDKVSNTVPVSSKGQCHAMFTITPKKLPKDKSSNRVDAGILETMKKKLLLFFGFLEDSSFEKTDNTSKLEKAIVALAKGRPKYIETELYEALSQFLPSLLIPAIPDPPRKFVDDQFSILQEYVDGIMTWENITAYRASFLNRTLGSVPRHKMMSEIPKNPYFFGSEDAIPPKLIQEKFDVLPYTRLTLNKGRLPYIPCKVRFYSLDDVRRCIGKRRSRNATTWIGFIGDSKVRERFEHILDVTKEFGWRLKNNGNDVSWELFDKVLRPMKTQLTMNALSTTGFSLSIAWSSKGAFTNYNSGEVSIYKMVDWLKEGADVPDLVVIAFGSWIFSHAYSNNLESLAAPDKAIRYWKDAKEMITNLAKKTTVLLLSQTRYRTYLAKEQVPYNNSEKALHAHLIQSMYKNVYFDHSTDWIDKVMVNFAKGTGAILWDSTLPFNLASIRECGILTQAHQEAHPAYAQIQLCKDSHHPSAPTIHDEFTMMMNFLCNEDLNQGDHYCC